MELPVSPVILSISRFFIGVVNDDEKYRLTEYTSEKKRTMFNFADELSGLKPVEQNRYHKNQFTVGQWLIQYSEPGPDGMTMKHYRQLPPGVELPKDRLASCIFGTRIQLDPSKYGLTNVTDKVNVKSLLLGSLLSDRQHLD